MTSGDKPSLVFYGDQGSLAAGGTTGINGLRTGMALVIPLYRHKVHTCDQSMKLYHQLNKLELAEKLVSSGTMSEKEYNELAKKIKEQLLSDK